jgi:hypothetical protein
MASKGLCPARRTRAHGGVTTTTTTSIDFAAGTITIDGQTVPLDTDLTFTTTTTTTTSTSASAISVTTSRSHAYTIANGGGDEEEDITMGLIDRLKHMRGRREDPKKKAAAAEALEMDPSPPSAHVTASPPVQVEGAAGLSAKREERYMSPYKSAVRATEGEAVAPASPASPATGTLAYAAEPLPPASLSASPGGRNVHAWTVHNESTHRLETTFPNGPAGGAVAGAVSYRPVNMSSSPVSSPQHKGSGAGPGTTDVALRTEEEIIASIDHTHVSMAKIHAHFPRVECTVLVHNISPEKQVTVRASPDDWRTYFDVSAVWQGTLGGGKVDKFACTFWAPQTRPQTLQICCMYQVCVCM